MHSNRYSALAIATIALGLWVHGGGTALGPEARDVVGDALWASMIVWWLGAIAPATPLLTRGAAALAICFAVEFSQLIHGTALDAVRRTTLGHLVLGSGFDLRDFASYTLGVTLSSLLTLSVMGRGVRR